MTRPMAEPWAEVKLTEQDVGNCWTGHEKLPDLRDNNVRG